MDRNLNHILNSGVKEKRQVAKVIRKVGSMYTLRTTHGGAVLNLESLLSFKVGAFVEVSNNSIKGATTPRERPREVLV